MKKAEEILNSKPSIDGQMNDLLFEYVDIIEAMQEYAKDQIQKDRERVKANLKDGLLIVQHKAIINHTLIILE